MAQPSVAVDDYVDEIVAKKGKHVYKEGLSESDWERELQQIPLFMSEDPGASGVMSEAMEALQALKFEDETADGRATCYKDEGNDCFKKKQYRHAVIAYTEGLKENVDDVQLRVTLLSNRAAANYRLGNNRSCFDDCKRAARMNPKHLKALVKGAEAANAMSHHQDTVEWCDRALQVEAGNKHLLEMRTNADKQFRLEERNRRKAAKEQQKRLKEEQRLEEAIRIRGIVLSTDTAVKSRFKDHEEDDGDEALAKGRVLASLEELEQSIPKGSRVQLADDGVLHWPVLFMYPQHKQTDFIQAFDERTCLQDQLSMMFAEAAPWDPEHQYSPANLSVYYEDSATGRLVSVSLDDPLLGLLRDKRFVVRSGTPVFIVVVRKSAFEKDFLKLYP